MSISKQPNKTEKLAAFETVVSEYEGGLLRYAARIVNDWNAAQDVVQDAFVRLFKRWQEELTPSPQLSSWLYRVTHNCAIDYLRKQVRVSSLHNRHAEEQSDSVPPNRGAAFRISEKAERAAAALEVLSLRERQLVVLKVYEEKSYREIAEIAGLTTGNVGYILHHAMKKLARALQYGPDANDPAGRVACSGSSSGITDKVKSPENE